MRSVIITAEIAQLLRGHLFKSASERRRNETGSGTKFVIGARQKDQNITSSGWPFNRTIVSEPALGSEETMSKSFLRDESGQNMVEFALLLTLIAAVAVIILIMMGGGISNVIAKITGKLQEVDNSSYMQKRRDLP
jgi:Flp pilus assembly pilin Flp